MRAPTHPAQSDFRCAVAIIWNSTADKKPVELLHILQEPFSAYLALINTPLLYNKLLVLLSELIIKYIHLHLHQDIGTYFILFSPGQNVSVFVYR